MKTTTTLKFKSSQELKNFNSTASLKNFIVNMDAMTLTAELSLEEIETAKKNFRAMQIHVPVFGPVQPKILEYKN